MKNKIDSFLSLSVALTGFEQIQLLGTGQAFTYFDIVCERTGNKNSNKLWKLWKKIQSKEENIEEKIRVSILSDPQLGPMARNIITLWYLGQWDAMPSQWISTYGKHSSDETVIISGDTYKEGLVWPAVGAHPMGAKQPGFDSWSSPPA
jgi:hypothetical protein